jgi:3'-phosphoadenosine 5'-phosphosulfate sulfotransferase (PAPS reductase)/FAD synthetase
MELKDIIENCPSNYEINKAWLVTDNKLKQFDRVVCSISGGSDSDIVLHLVATLDKEKKVTYVFFDTGLEFKATKEHIKQLQEKYNVEITTIRSERPVPYCCKKYGVPFLSKHVSEFIYRLQNHDFKFEDKPFEELIKEYPKCSSALKWWCNKNGDGSHFNISNNRWLKEFLLENPPHFKVSNKCCTYAKKGVVKKFVEENDFDLDISGVRKYERGIRAAAYKNCFTEKSEKNIASYRPVFWFTNSDKDHFKTHYGIRYSDCYEDWGLKRTGCSGCPYAVDFDGEIEAVRIHEPKLYKALINIFGESYEYTRKYKEFCKKMNIEEKGTQK